MASQRLGGNKGVRLGKISNFTSRARLSFAEFLALRGKACPAHSPLQSEASTQCQVCPPWPDFTGQHHGARDDDRLEPDLAREIFP
jgi:hypothetical protein